MSLSKILQNQNNNQSFDFNFPTMDINTEHYNESYLTYACEGLITDLCSVDKAFEFGNVLGEVKCINEGLQENDASALLENLVKTGINKIVEAFKKLWAKVKSWFATLKKYIDSFLLKGEEFVKKYGDELKKKDKKGFSYKAYKYNTDAGDKMVENIQSKVTAEVDKFLSCLEVDITEIDSTFNKNSNREDDDTEDPGRMTNTLAGNPTYRHKKQKTKTVSMNHDNFSGAKKEDLVKALLKNSVITPDDSTSDYTEKFISSLNINADNTGELKENIKLEYHNNMEDKEEFEEFETESVDNMITAVSKGNKTIKTLKNHETEFNNMMNKVIKKYDSITEKVNEQAYKVAQIYSGFTSALLTIGNAALDVKGAMVKEMLASYEDTLKSFLRYKPKKEGYSEYDNNSFENSLLEEAFRYI